MCQETDLKIHKYTVRIYLVIFILLLPGAIKVIPDKSLVVAPQQGKNTAVSQKNTDLCFYTFAPCRCRWTGVINAQ